MDILPINYMPGDPMLIETIVCELKSQGIFDSFRKECISDVDTKPAYQNLRQRVEGSVSSFLRKQTWTAGLNKNQLREKLRKNICESGFLETGVERIVDQVVNPKINSVFLPKVIDVVYTYLGLEKPDPKTEQDTEEDLKIKSEKLLPKELEAVSPESRPGDKNYESDLSQEDMKMEEDESPPFEPLGDDNSMDSHLSGISGLQSHESNQSVRALQIDESQASKNSSEESNENGIEKQIEKIEIDKKSTENITMDGSLNAQEDNAANVLVKGEEAAELAIKKEMKKEDTLEGVENKEINSKKESKSESKNSLAKPDRDKERQERRHDSSSRSKDKRRDRERDRQRDRDRSKDKDRDRSKSDKDAYKSSSRHSSSRKDDKRDRERRDRDKDRDKDRTGDHKGSTSSRFRDEKRSRHDSHKDKRSSSSRSEKDRGRDKEKKEKANEKKDDHYSCKNPKSTRRSTDRDSNDGSGMKSSPSSNGDSTNSSQNSQTNKDSLKGCSDPNGNSGGNESKHCEAPTASTNGTDELQNGMCETMSVSAASWDALEAQLISNVKIDTYPDNDSATNSQEDRDDLEYFSEQSMKTEEKAVDLVNACIEQIGKQIEHLEGSSTPAESGCINGELDGQDTNKENKKKNLKRKNNVSKKEGVIKKPKVNNLASKSPNISNTDFHLPLSPAESDCDKNVVNSDKKADVDTRAPVRESKPSRKNVNITQRYSSEDLYKPRPTFKRTTSRLRGNNME